MSNNYKVYCLTNTITNEKYIGVTKQKIYGRFKAGKGYKPTTKINLAIEKYGWKNFKYEILFECDDKELAGEKEKEYIKMFNTVEKGYNNASGGFKGYTQTFSETQKKNLSLSHKGKHYSPETEFKKGYKNEYTLSIMKPVLCVETGIIYESMNVAEKTLGISHHIWDCIKGNRNICGGYHWKLVGGEE